MLWVNPIQRLTKDLRHNRISNTQNMDGARVAIQYRIAARLAAVVIQDHTAALDCVRRIAPVHGTSKQMSVVARCHWLHGGGAPVIGIGPLCGELGRTDTGAPGSLDPGGPELGDLGPWTLGSWNLGAWA